MLADNNHELMVLSSGCYYPDPCYPIGGGEMKTLIFGAGPAGLAAAHAASCMGSDVMIISKGARKSKMNGAQYLHRPIPMASRDGGFQIDYVLVGTSDKYREKVGYPSSTLVSVEHLVGKKHAWDIRSAYDWLWDTYGEYVQPDELNPGKAWYYLDSLKPDVAISTIPAKMLCEKAYHSFAHINVWSSDTAITSIADNTVICDGTIDKAWYRCSMIGGQCNTEWPGNRRPPLSSDHLWSVTKPIKTTCDCLPEVHRMGRYGRWEKGVLVDDAFYRTAELIAEADNIRNMFPTIDVGDNYAI